MRHESLAGSAPPNRRRAGRLALAGFALTAVLACTRAAAPPRYVGSAACASCHAAPYRAWSESLHAWAMRAAATAMLEVALRRPPTRIEALRALVAVHLELGNREAARRWAREAVANDPPLGNDPRLRALLSE